MADNKKYVELLWAEKYDKYEKGEKIPIEKPNLPFQVVETVNKPRLKDLEDGLFDPDKYYPENEYPVKRIRKNVQEYDMVKRLNVANDVVLFYSKTKSHRILQPREEKKREERWHAFDAPDLRTGMDYELFGKKPPIGRHWMWSKEKAEEAIKEGKLRANPRTGRPEYLVGSAKSVITTMWDDISAYSFTYDFNTEKSEALLERILQMSSNPGDIVADFFCGSGTTLAAAEKLGRRWIGSDLSKFAIQVTRKRLLDIHNSKDLQNEGKKYGNPARPFELWNIGNYETVYWQEREDEYLAFMLKLYQSQPLTGFRYLHGRKGERAVHVGPLNAPVTMEEVELKITDFQLAPTAELVEIASKVKDSRELIDYWAIDWDYKGDTFHNQWQSFRMKKNPKVEYEARHKYEEAGEYQIMTKVVDVFGNDTNKVLKVRVK